MTLATVVAMNGAMLTPSQVEALHYTAGGGPVTVLRSVLSLREPATPSEGDLSALRDMGAINPESGMITDAGWAMLRIALACAMLTRGL